MDDLTGLQLIAQGTSWTDRALDIITTHGLQGYDTWEYPTHGLGGSSALNECADPGRLVTLLWRLNDLNPSRKLRICISSRPSSFSVPGAEIRLEDNNSLDIQRYLGESLLALENYLPPTSDVKQTTQVLVEKAEGMFLWASLNISQLRCDGHFKTPKSEQHSTSWLPATLDAAYETIIQQLWSRHDESRREMARDAFTLVLCAQRPLSILELRSALAAMHYDPDLLSPLTKSEVNEWACNAQYHFRVAWICLLYVDLIYMLSNLLNTETAITSALFLEYSLSFGMAHLSLAERAGVNPMKEMCHLSQFQKGFVDQWSLLHSQVFKDQKLFEPHKTKAVHIMSYYGLPWYDTGLWGARLAEINEEDHYGRTPLSLAAAMGHHHICEILLDNGDDMGHRDYVYGQTPLSHAAAYGHREVVELLLSEGSDYDDSSSGVTALWLAQILTPLASILAKHACPMLPLLDTSEDTRDKNGWTPLHHAVSQGRKKTIELLLGLLKSQELFKLKENLSKDKGKGSWINTILTAIVILACYQRGGEWQTPPVGNQNSQALNTCSDGQLLINRGTNRQKHKLGAGKDEDDNEENIRGNSEKRPRRPEPNGDRFACPYHKKNLARFTSGPCNGKGFENIDRLKAPQTKRMLSRRIVQMPFNNTATE
ncbi:hypothetical protein BFJ68_g1314 [Fusarium oxysporum]|uniref:Uncharacterized protein n=1 Tax=Fusarium oxysporum TaxID=5507 RepID=A0A420S1F0_FUSOX|nr:hypothetical protein BFJ68_g1314 [Fusarium oxysporum]